MAEAWAPTLEQVATRIPTRTRDATTPGDDALLVTFNAQTTPTDEQARRFIDAAVLEVLAAAGGSVPTAPPHLPPLAGEAAALRAAADIELAYPQRDGDTSIYELLNARANDAMTRLVAAVDDAGAGPEGSLLPAYTFPQPAWPGDYSV